MMRRSRFAASVAAATLCLGLVAACGGDDKDTQVVKFGTAGIQGTAVLAAHLTTLGQGYYDEVENEFGVEIQFTDIDPSAAIQMLDSGSVDVLSTAMDTYALARVKGFDFQTLVEGWEKPNIALVALKKYEKDRGDDLAAFKDASWGYPAPGSSPEAVSNLAATRAGLDWESVEKIAYGQLTAGVAALEGGRIDIIAIDVGNAGKMVANGTGYVVYNSNVGTEIVGGGPSAKASWIKENPKVAQALVDAYLKGMNDLQKVVDDPEKVLALFPKNYQDLMRSGFAESWVIARPAQRTDGRFDESQVKETIDYLTTYGSVDKKDAALLEGIWDNSLVDTSTVRVEVS
ncbi:ABC-type nitrate/sulfonate/bicarbonate transport system substrate-binding protein [Rhodococcus sp. 27YEA15]|uniref:ABC transporter substrate-binding protein n=1 Tax=Rhodococcus sp. 27YEA15 TaxID=3156259 RepID=UPI003C79BB55